MFGEKVLIMNAKAEIRLPTIPTFRQPHLFTNAATRGPKTSKPYTFNEQTHILFQQQKYGCLNHLLFQKFCLKNKILFLNLKTK